MLLHCFSGDGATYKNMNKIVASFSLVALSAASVQAQSTAAGETAISSPPPKWWSVAATVRGFYDDNANTAPNGTPKVATWGYELNPSISVTLGNQQTSFSASYAFHYLYYEKPLATVVGTHGVHQDTTKDDQDHTFTAALDHAFNQSYSLHLLDTFVIGQQPDALRAGNAITVFQRVPGNNIINMAGITVDGELSRELGFQVGYNNNLFNYDDAQLAGILNRIENYAHFDLRWIASQETVGVLGYQFGYINYTGTGAFSILDDPTPANPLNTSTISILNTISHSVYAGVDHTFLPNLKGSVRAGASYYDYYNDTGASGFGPYAQASLTYTYAPESSVSIGFQEGRIASSIQSTNGVVHDTETSVVYATLVHRIMPNLFGSIQGTFQNSSYNGGGPGIDGDSDRFYDAGAELEYRFNPFVSVHAGYDYSRLGSSVTVLGARDYDRNKFYIGATARY